MQIKTLFITDGTTSYTFTKREKYFNDFNNAVPNISNCVYFGYSSFNPSNSPGSYNFFHCKTYATNSLGSDYLIQEATSYDGKFKAVRNKSPNGWSSWEVIYNKNS